MGESPQSQSPTPQQPAPQQPEEHEALQVGRREIYVPIHGVYMIGFEHAGYEGDFTVFYAEPLKSPEPSSVTTFRADLGQFGKLGNDRLSSLRVGPRANVLLCEHVIAGGCGGASLQFSKNAKVEYVGDEFNDRCSFIKLTKIPR